LKPRLAHIRRRRLFVAPFTGAWIETFNAFQCRAILAVAPFTGAWIETFQFVIISMVNQSRPSRARGLKQESLLPSFLLLSRPSRARGLKQIRRVSCKRFSSRALHGRVD